MYRRLGIGSITSDLAGAIQRFEGACSGPTDCRNNNPGNLRAYTSSQPVDSRGFRIFPDYASGEAALQSQIDLNISRGLSLDEFFGGKSGVYAGYAPSADSNNPSAYASTVAGWLGIDPTVPLGELPAGSSSTPPYDDVPGPPDFPVGDSGGMSTGAMVALGIAGLGVLWALTN
jgi:hypothetical protein